jgi:hypothetical protein
MYIKDSLKFRFKKLFQFLRYKVLKFIVDQKQLSDSTIWGVVFRIRISPGIRSQNRNGSKCSARDLGQSDLCKNLGKFGSLPCPFNFQIFSLYNVTFLTQVRITDLHEGLAICLLCE